MLLVSFSRLTLGLAALVSNVSESLWRDSTVDFSILMKSVTFDMVVF
jgi:hypothetical protein